MAGAQFYQDVGMEKIWQPTCVYHTGPVTALHVVDKFVLAGIGSYVYTYDITNNSCLERSLYLPYVCVHGIRKGTGLSSPDMLCIFGGKSCKVLKFSSAKKDNSGRKLQQLNIEDLTPVVEVEDWIWDASFLCELDNGDVVLALGHNVILRWNWKSNTMISRTSCCENSILYCATFIGQSWENLILAAGTVYNQVLLWSPSTVHTVDSKADVIQRLTGHQGVIFSIDYNNGKHQVCSVSDDRSIRLYQLTFPSQSDERNQAVTSGDYPSLSDWQECRCELLLVLYGHSARVWDVKLLSSCIVSVGEDSTCCVWDYQGNIKQRFKGHKGKSIWSLVVDKEEKFVVTGGGDTSVRLWLLQQADDEEANTIHQSTLSLPDSQSTGDFPRTVALLDKDLILTMTNKGDLLTYNTTTEVWQTVMSDAVFRSYAVMSVCPYRKDMVLLGSISGCVRLLVKSPQIDTWERHDWEIYSGKVFSIQWLHHDMVLTTGPDGEITLWRLRHATHNISFNKLHTYHLPVCKQRWVSAAAMVTTHHLLVCGDRGGTVHVYQMVMNEQTDVSDPQEPIQSFVKIHGKAGVTDVRCYGEEVYTAGRDGHYRKYSVENGRLVLLTSCRVYKGLEWIDRLQVTEHGDIYIYGFQSSDFVLWSTVNNQKLIQIACGGGHRTWDCHIHGNMFTMVYLKARDIVHCQVEMWKNQVLLKDSLHGREITCVKYIGPCLTDGCILITGSEDTSIIVSILHYNSWNIMRQSELFTLQGHISNVRTLAMCESALPQCNRNRKLVFSGGGRAQLIVWRLTFPDNFDSVDQKKLCYSENLCSFMLGQDIRYGRTRSWKLQQRKVNPETRFMDLTAVTLASVIDNGPDYLHVVCAACSDGFVRFFLFDEKQQQLSVFAESEFHNHCVLKVTYFKYKTRLIFLSAATDGIIALWDISKSLMEYICKFYRVCEDTCSSSIESSAGRSEHICESSEGSTNVSNSVLDSSGVSAESLNKLSDSLAHGSDGKNVTRRTQEPEHSSDLKPVFICQSHQSGINALHVKEISDSEYMIASGGDDNAIHISVISLIENSGSLHITTVDTASKLDAHATQITGIHILSRTSIMSVSIDQRLSVWGLKTTSSGTEIRPLSSKFVNVADIHCMDVHATEHSEQRDQTNVLIAGQGLSYFQI